MANLANQKILQIADKTKQTEAPAFITEDVVEVSRAKLRYYIWLCRLMAFLATLSLFYGVCVVLAILKLVPEIMIDPQLFVYLTDSQSLVKREHINYRMESRESIMINFMKQYVELRNTFIKDESEMQKRWLWGGLVSYLSTQKVYKAFEEEYPKVTQEMLDLDASRSVEILSVERVGGEKSYIWNIEFKTYDFTYKNDDYKRLQDIQPKIIERHWTTNIRSYIDPYRRTAYKRLLNPLGFVVSEYSQSEKSRLE